MENSFPITENIFCYHCQHKLMYISHNAETSPANQPRNTL